MMIGEYCGDSTMPVTRPTPAAASARTAASIRGSECSMPTATTYRPGPWPSSSARCSASPCSPVIRTSGDQPTISYLRWNSATTAGSGSPPPRTLRR